MGHVQLIICVELFVIFLILIIFENSFIVDVIAFVFSGNFGLRISFFSLFGYEVYH